MSIERTSSHILTGYIRGPLSLRWPGLPPSSPAPSPPLPPTPFPATMSTHSLFILLLTVTLSASSSPIPPLGAGPFSALSNTGLSSSNAILSPNVLSMASRPRMMLPLAKRVNSTGSANIVKFDQDRARATRQRSQASDATGPAGGSFAVGQAFNDVAISQAVSYVVEVRVLETLDCLGLIALPRFSLAQLHVSICPAAPICIVLIDSSTRKDSLLVDTGSSNTWVGAGKPFVPSASTRPTGDIVVSALDLPPQETCLNPLRFLPVCYLRKWIFYGYVELYTLLVANNK